jgi:septal ring factor EnvC (AmiA/AmiB activator)
MHAVWVSSREWCNRHGLETHKLQFEINTLTSRLDTVGRQLAKATDCRLDLEKNLEQMRISEQQLKLNAENMRKAHAKQVTGKFFNRLYNSITGLL